MSTEKKQSLYEASPKLSRKTSAKNIGHGETRETDTTFNEFTENIVNAEVSKSGRRKSLVKDRRESKLPSEEESSTKLFRRKKSLMKSVEEADPCVPLKQKIIGSNDDSETKLLESPNVPLKEKCLSKGLKHADSPKLSKRKKSFAEGSKIDDSTKETCLKNSGRRASLRKEDIPDQFSCILKAPSKSEDNEKEYLPSPKISRRRKSLAKGDEAMEHGLSALQEQNDSEKTDGRLSNVISGEDEKHGGLTATQVEWREDPVEKYKAQLISQQNEPISVEHGSHMTKEEIVTQEEISVAIHKQNHQRYVEVDRVMIVKHGSRRSSIIKKGDSRSKSSSPNVSQRRKSLVRSEESNVKSEEKETRMMQLCHRKTYDDDGDMCKTKVTNLTYSSKRRKSIVNSETSGIHDDSLLNNTETGKYVGVDEEMGTQKSSLDKESTCKNKRVSVVKSCNNDDDDALDQLQHQTSNDENNDKEKGVCKSPKSFRKKKKSRKLSRSSSDRPRRASLIKNADGSFEKADNTFKVAAVMNSPQTINNGEDVTKEQIFSPSTQELVSPLHLAKGFANMKIQDPPSPLTRQKRTSMQATDEQGQYRSNDDMMFVSDLHHGAIMQPPSFICNEKERNQIEDSADIKQVCVSQRKQRRRKSIQDADDLRTRTSPRARHRELVGYADDETRQASISPRERARHRLIKDADDAKRQASLSPRVRHRKLIKDADDTKRHASMSPRERARHRLIKDADDAERQASLSPRLRHRKLIKDADDTKRHASMSPRERARQTLIKDADDVKRQESMSPQVHQRRKCIQDADAIKTHALQSPLVRPRRKSIKDPGDVATHAIMSPNFQRRKSIQDNDENIQQTCFPSRLRQRRKSVQDTEDIASHSVLSPLLQRRGMFVRDTTAFLSPNLQQRRKSLQYNDENMRIITSSTNLLQRRKSIQDSDEDMVHSPLSPLAPQRRRSIQRSDYSMNPTQTGHNLHSFQHNDAMYGPAFMSPQLQRRRESIPEIDGMDVPTEMRVRPRRKSFQGGERFVPPLPTSHTLYGRGKYTYDSDGMAARSLLSPSVRQMLQRTYDRRNLDSPVEKEEVTDRFSYNDTKDAQQEYDPVFEDRTEHQVIDPYISQVADKSFMLSSPRLSKRLPAGTVQDTNEDVAISARGRRKHSLPMLSLHSHEVYDQTQQDAKSSTELSPGLNEQQIDENSSPSCGRDSKPALVLKDIREKLAKSNRRSSFPAISGIGGILGMDIGVKQLELPGNVGPFSRSARKALRASSNSLAQDASDPEPYKAQRRRKCSLPTNMLAQFIHPGSEAMANTIPYFQQPGQIEAPRRKTRRMSLPDANMCSGMGFPTTQSFCHHIPGEFRRIGKHVTPTSENLYPGMDFEDITPDEEIILGMEKHEIEHEDDLPQNLSPTSPVVSDIEDKGDEKGQKGENQSPSLEREHSVSEETVLPPRTPEPEVMAEFCEDVNGPENPTNGSSVYQPKYCWCTRCKMMYRMYKDDDSKLEAWGNYPCFKF